MNKKITSALALAFLFSLSACSHQPDPLTDVRNNWSRYIYTGETHYTYSLLGGIDAFDIPVENNTNFILDEVTLSVTYIKKSGGVFKTERVSVSNIPPHSMKKVKAPDSPRGVSVDMGITNVISRDMKFIFPSSNGLPGDPYLYN
jgi:hypothetical protein